MNNATFGNPPDDPLGAFCRENHAALKGSGSGPLAGLTFAAKDVFDIAGVRTGFGSPTWLTTHPPAEATSPAVQRLLDAGADMVGKALTDELTYSLSGQNAHYGTPVNPAAPERIPGGSSSGSASAVAGGLADFALGTDCGGSAAAPRQLLRHSRHPAQPWPGVAGGCGPVHLEFRCRWLVCPGSPTFLPLSAACCWMTLRQVRGSPLHRRGDSSSLPTHSGWST